MKRNKPPLRKPEEKPVVNQPEPKKKFMKLTLPLWQVFVLVGVIFIVMFFVNSSSQKVNPKDFGNVPAVSKQSIAEIEQRRLSGYQFTNPLLFVDIEKESESFKELKASITSIIEKDINAKKINSASVYLKRCQNGEWFSINPEETFYTASLMKVAVLITILKMSESIPGYLDQVHNFRYADPRILRQSYGEKTIIVGKDYKIRELLHYMIVYSDNYASNILNNKMDIYTYTKLFKDIGIENYDPSDRFRKLNAFQIGKLFQLLYNASYISKENSEYALSLLTQCNFKDGLIKGLPSNVLTAHKFAEAGGTEENQLHDAGIVYDGATPYLIMVMTRGKEISNLSNAISEISKSVYDYLHTQESN